MFIRSSMCNNMDCIVKSDRVLAVKVHNCIFISVYFPVFRSSPEYDSEISSIVGVIDIIVADNAQLPIIIGGDFNLEFHDGSTLCYAVNNFMTSANLFRCSTTETTTCCILMRRSTFYYANTLLLLLLIAILLDCNF